MTNQELQDLIELISKDMQDHCSYPVGIELITINLDNSDNPRGYYILGKTNIGFRVDLDFGPVYEHRSEYGEELVHLMIMGQAMESGFTQITILGNSKTGNYLSKQYMAYEKLASVCDKLDCGLQRYSEIVRDVKKALANHGEEYNV
jgi:hypothetical protein